MGDVYKEVVALNSSDAFWKYTADLLKEIKADGGGGKVLSLRATGRLEHSYNLASTTFDNNRATNNSATYRISFRARWVNGSPQLNTPWASSTTPCAPASKVPRQDRAETPSMPTSSSSSACTPNTPKRPK